MTASPATTPVLRALPTVAALPGGYVAHLVTDTDAEPHVMAGELAVVDTADRSLVHGELFVIRVRSPHTDSGFRERIVEARSHPYRSPGEPDGWRWWAAPHVRPRSGAELEAWADAGRPIGLSMGPFKPGAMEEMLVGRVVGILAAAFEEPTRAGRSAA